MPVARPSSGGTNGMAIAALILGISAFVCLGPLGGLLAVVFGILGLSKAKQIGTGRGMSIAGIILGALGTIVSILVLVLFVFGATEAVKNIGGVADPSTYELVVSQNTCKVQYGFVTYEGTIKNKTGSEKNFNINTEIRNSSSKSVIDTPNDIVYNIAPGDTAQWSVSLPVNSDVQTSCKVLNVENWFNNN